MRKQLFYFIRHGQSLFNARGLRQDSHGPLSDRGVEQAHITGERLEEEQNLKNPMDIIISSPYDRAKETALIIQEHIKVIRPIEYNDLLQERRNPSEIVGKSVDDPEVKKIIDTIDHSYHDDNFRYSDEENFADLKNRAKECLKFLQSRKENKIVVVTHGIFLKMLIAYMVNGDTLSAVEYNKLSFFNPSNNASITIAQYTSTFFPSKYRGWKLLVWDDYISIKGRNTII